VEFSINTASINETRVQQQEDQSRKRVCGKRSTNTDKQPTTAAELAETGVIRVRRPPHTPIKSQQKKKHGPA
jgi:hypothetical protein